jgi:hypothetical protein
MPLIGSNGVIAPLSGNINTGAPIDPLPDGSYLLRNSGGGGGGGGVGSTQPANTVLAAPDGATGATGYRLLVAADIPNLSAAKITSGLLPVPRGGTGLSTIPAGAMLYGSALDTLAPLVKPLAASVLTHDTTAPAWVTALAKAQLPTETAYKDANNIFTVFQEFNRTGATNSALGVRVSTDAQFRTLIRADGRVTMGDGALVGDWVLAYQSAALVGITGNLNMSGKLGIGLASLTGTPVAPIHVVQSGSGLQDALAVANHTTAAAGVGPAILFATGTGGATSAARIGAAYAGSSKYDLSFQVQLVAAAGPVEVGKYDAATGTWQLTGGLRVSSTAATFRPPLMTTAQRLALTAAQSDEVFDSDLDRKMNRRSAAWFPLGATDAKRASADVALSASTTINLTALDIAVKSGEVYEVEYVVFATVSGGTAGLKPIFTLPASSSGKMWAWGHAGSATTQSTDAPSTTPGTAYATGFVTASFTGGIWVKATLTMGADGTLRFGVATGASAAGNLLAGSYVRYTKVA